MTFDHIVLVLIVLLVVVLGLMVAWGMQSARIAPVRTGGADVAKDLTKHPRSLSEATVVRYFEELTGESFPTVYPDWLTWRGRAMELDGYSKKLKIAVEFSGPLHTKWYPEREAYMRYHTRLAKDAAKLAICKAHGVHLVVVDMALPPHHWRNYVCSRLFDLGVVETCAVYLDKQTAVPYRNEQLDREIAQRTTTRTPRARK